MLFIPSLVLILTHSLLLTPKLKYPQNNPLKDQFIWDGWKLKT